MENLGLNSLYTIIGVAGVAVTASWRILSKITTVGNALHERCNDFEKRLSRLEGIDEADRGR